MAPVEESKELLTVPYKSSIVTSTIDKQWIIDQLPSKPKTLELLFSSAVHGWKLSDWRSKVFNKGSTLTLFKSTKNRVSGGYLHINWKEGSGIYQKDERAYIFSVDH